MKEIENNFKDYWLSFMVEVYCVNKIFQPKKNKFLTFDNLFHTKRIKI